jgi:hypothetical protein
MVTIPASNQGENSGNTARAPSSSGIPDKTPAVLTTTADSQPDIRATLAELSRQIQQINDNL